MDDRLVCSDGDDVHQAGNSFQFVIWQISKYAGLFETFRLLQQGHRLRVTCSPAYDSLFERRIGGGGGLQRNTKLHQAVKCRLHEHRIITETNGRIDDALRRLRILQQPKRVNRANPCPAIAFLRISRQERDQPLLAAKQRLWQLFFRLVQALLWFHLS